MKAGPVGLSIMKQRRIAAILKVRKKASPVGLSTMKQRRTAAIQKVRRKASPAGLSIMKQLVNVYGTGRLQSDAVLITDDAFYAGHACLCATCLNGAPFHSSITAATGSNIT